MIRGNAVPDPDRLARAVAKRARKNQKRALNVLADKIGRDNAGLRLRVHQWLRTGRVGV